MKPLVVFPDPEAALIDYYVTAFAGRVEPYKPTTITTGFPASTATYHLQVELEAGNADDYPVTERAQVRVNCWAPAGKRSDVKSLASLAQGLAYAHPGSSTVIGCSIPGGRSDVITDPDTKRLMCWFLVRVDLKATLLAS